MALLFILLAIFIPILLKDRMKLSFQDKTKLDKDNINLCGKFPRRFKNRIKLQF